MIEIVNEKGGKWYVKATGIDANADNGWQMAEQVVAQKMGWC